MIMLTLNTHHTLAYIHKSERSTGGGGGGGVRITPIHPIHRQLLSLSQHFGAKDAASLLAAKSLLFHDFIKLLEFIWCE